MDFLESRINGQREGMRIKRPNFLGGDSAFEGAGNEPRAIMS